MRYTPTLEFLAPIRRSFFRRLRYVQEQLGRRSQFISASATIADPAAHLRRLFALDFEILGEDADTSPAHGTELHLILPPREEDLLTETSRLLRHLATSPQDRFIAFVDSRKQAEQISSIVARSGEGEDADVGEADEPKIPFEALKRSQVLPFRAGYEESDREVIFSRLRQGTLKGVVSTSSLELGIDIPGLTVGVLVGVPRSATSLRQRIGRIGRERKGDVYVINSGDMLDEAIFREPHSILERPFAESALYLENPRIQYIHALCLARAGGEHDQAVGGSSGTEIFDSRVEWPDGFLALCRKERIGELTIDLQSMKAESGDEPNRIFPLNARTSLSPSTAIVHHAAPLERAKFIVLFDQVYGSLRLSGRLMEDGVLPKVLESAADLAIADGTQIADALRTMRSALDSPFRALDMGGRNSDSASSTLVRVVLPGGKGLNVRNGNEEFEVDSIFFNPVFNELCYRGHTQFTAVQRRNQQPGSTILPISAVVPVPGESAEGDYDLMTGEVRPVSPV